VAQKKQRAGSHKGLNQGGVGASVRNAFLDFFKNKTHTIVPSAPLVPQNDPSLLFVNAGMVPFKDFFMGKKTPPFQRATSAQKCVRAGGKHNDLDQVGYTKRHHTFFEMLGNFSFGDYFKEEAISYAFEFLIKELKLAQDRLYITYYHTDHETQALWKKISGLSEERLIPISTNDNFWSMGASGPCGPCTEIFYDHGEHLWGGLPGTKEEDGDRFVEIWNVVFMQFNQNEDGSRVLLPQKGVDTGAGLERLTAVMEGVDDNYDTDLFQPLIREACARLKLSVHEVTPQMKGQSHKGGAGKEKISSALKVLADHTRAAGFLMADGVMPSSDARGYVLRRVIRRAMMHGLQLGAKGPLMTHLVTPLCEVMGQAYPELLAAESFICKTLESEEASFQETLHRGTVLLEEKINQLKKGQSILPGEWGFQLYDTHGLPKDTLMDLLSAKGLTLDEKGFDEALEAQKARAREASGFRAAENSDIWASLAKNLGPTNFKGYSATHTTALVQALVKDGVLVREVSVLPEGVKAGTKELKAGKEKDLVAAKDGEAGKNGDTTYIEVVFDETPFYGESGGQMGDQGTLVSLESEEGHSAPVYAEVIDAQKREGLIIHHVKITKGTLQVGGAYALSIDKERRQGLKAHHSATHLVHAVLRTLLGEHVTQRGSLVEAHRLRFDFSHDQRLSKDTLLDIEHRVNHMIRAAAPVSICEMPLEAARTQGAMALFGEAYGERVRVVTMGLRAEDAANPDEEFDGVEKSSKGMVKEGHKLKKGAGNKHKGQSLKGAKRAQCEEGAQPMAHAHTPFSIELCGGTHVSNTGEVGFFKILSETGIAKGVRRLEAVVGKAAENYIHHIENHYEAAKLLLKTNDAGFLEKLQKTLHSVKKGEGRTHESLASSAQTEAPVIAQEGDLKYVVQLVAGKTSADLHRAVDGLIKTYGPKQEGTEEGISGVLVLAVQVMNQKGAFKTTLLLGSAAEAPSAKEVMGRMMIRLEGRGGGKAHRAQGGFVGKRSLKDLMNVLKNACL